MNADFFEKLLNFMPGSKRLITFVVAVALYAWHQAFLLEFISFDVPSAVLGIAALFGFNALAQGSKNDAKAAADKAAEAVMAQLGNTKPD